MDLPAFKPKLGGEGVSMYSEASLASIRGDRDWGKRSGEILRSVRDLGVWAPVFLVGETVRLPFLKQP